MAERGEIVTRSVDGVVSTVLPLAGSAPHAGRR
jgi:hypothetical protein